MLLVGQEYLCTLGELCSLDGGLLDRLLHDDGIRVACDGVDQQTAYLRHALAVVDTLDKILGKDGSINVSLLVEGEGGGVVASQLGLDIAINVTLLRVESDGGCDHIH